MDDDVAWEAIDHAYAVAVWIMKYIDRHKLPVTEDETFPSFKHNMIRLNSILRGLNYKMLHNPLLSDAILQGKTPDKDYTEPAPEIFI